MFVIIQIHILGMAAQWTYSEKQQNIHEPQICICDVANVLSVLRNSLETSIDILCILLIKTVEFNLIFQQMNVCMYVFIFFKYKL